MSKDLAHEARTSRREVFTFYSYKGGTGRSMLLANVAWQLASAGSKVLVIDWDLEAPGLHRYFKPFLGDDPELKEQKGVIEWVIDYWEAFLDRPEADVEDLVRECADPRHYVRKLETGSLIADGGIDLLCAGRQDAFYARAVADFDWTRLWEKLKGDAFIDASRKILVGPDGYDFVLVDSRTGVSDTSGFCTVALADTLVVCFTYNNQSVIGASQIARDIKRQSEKLRGPLLNPGSRRRFRLFAVPSRVEDLDPERLEKRQRQAWAAFADLLTDVAPRQQSEYWVGVQIRNQALFAYEEVLAACMNRPSDPQSVLGAVAHLTRWLTDDAFQESPPLSDAQRAELRERFADTSAAASPLVDRQSWDLFVEQMPDPDGREAILQGCFGLLVQLVAIGVSTKQSSSTTNSLPFVRTMLLEADLTEDERRMAEILTSACVTQRRITDGRQRGLMLRDESILANWSQLQNRLAPHHEFIEARERIQRARQSWEAGGRSLVSLHGFQNLFLGLDITDEKRAWLGRPNLQFYEVAQELLSWRERNKRDLWQTRKYFLAVVATMAVVLVGTLYWQYHREMRLRADNLVLSYRADVAKTWELMRKKRFDEAATGFGKLVSELPGDPSPLQGRAIARAQLGDPRGAAIDLKQAIDLMEQKLDPVDATNYYLLGKYYKDANEISDATFYFSRYQKLASLSGASAFEQLYLRDAEWELNGGLESKIDLRQARERAWKLIQDQAFKDAYLVLGRLTASEPDNACAWLGRYYAGQKLKMTSAESDFKMAIEIMTKNGGRCDPNKPREMLGGSATF